MAEQSDYALWADGVGCVRGEREIFRDLNFSLADGEALMLTGPNGVGKSSLLRLVACLGRAEAGEIRRYGSLIWRERESHVASLHYVGHATGVKPALSCAEDLAFWSNLHDDGSAGGGTGGASEAARNAALHHFGLAQRADFPVRFLSSGERRRLALARLLAVPASLWLLDEPAIGLDEGGLAALRGALDAHLATGGSALIASHTPIETAGRTRSLNLTPFTTPGFPEMAPETPETGA